MTWDVQHPLWLWLLVFAFLPLIRRRRDSIVFSHVEWIPDDPIGIWLDRLWRALAALTMAAIVVGLADPGVRGEKQIRTGRGAEVLIMLDRSSSMDAVPRRRATRDTVSGPTADKRSTSKSKNQVARELLTEFVTQRPNERFSLMTFSTRSMLVAPFADHNRAVLGGLAATGIGRGLPKTNLGSALIRAIAQFEDRSYSGSRVILIVSDGGAQLDRNTQQAIRSGVIDHRISLYFLYIRSTGSPADLTAVDESSSTRLGEEVLLHRFFEKLSTPYNLFQSDDPQSMKDALAQIASEHNKPLTYYERVARMSLSHWSYGFALIGGLLLLVHLAFQYREFDATPNP